ncbi:hypothetical protein ACFYPT_37840 [Streptomyces sp. NPDC005529]|uniref:hypothetical protein n=1 Tax=unclassified Streptomyces TaxID=2593676 RepID=UPI0033ACDBBB
MGILWQWRFEDGDGTALPHQTIASCLEAIGAPHPGLAAETPESGFAMQGDAETWIGLSWRLLLDAGVVQVVLLENDREVYGPILLFGGNPRL